MINRNSYVVALGIVLGWLLIQSSPVSAAAMRKAQYASLDYDVVYVRCPRARPTVIQPDGSGNVLLNWNGVNDVWLDVSNNVYQQPGCDLVLHHSDPAYNNLPVGDRGREEVLVNCDENDPSKPICSIADPNVSFDGRSVIYTKFTDTRRFVTDEGVYGAGGVGPTRPTQSFMSLFPNGNGSGGAFAQRLGSSLKAYDAPALIYRYDLQSRQETQISPAPQYLGGRAYPGNAEWHSNVPVMDTGPFFMSDGRIGFTSNRANGFYQFQLFAMNQNGSGVSLIGHRAMGQQLHPAVLKDGRVMYTSQDVMLQKVDNNNYSLFTINTDGSNPFILAGKQSPTAFSYHYATQLSDGDVVVALYYNHNNTGLGSLLRFPIDPSGADFTHLQGPVDATTPYVAGAGWKAGTSLIPFARTGQFLLTPQADWGDAQTYPYRSAADYWTHPSDGRTVTMRGRFTHPAAAPDNDLLVTYTIGGSSTMDSPSFYDLASTMQIVGKDAGIWLMPLDPNSAKRVQHIADDGRLVVDFPEYHEIMARPVVPYGRIYGVARPGLDVNSQPTPQSQVTENTGTKDPRLPAGAPWALTGAASLYDRETRSLNGIPWNMADGGGVMAGRTYLNLAANGADLAVFNNSEIYGIRVLMPLPPVPNSLSGGIEQWAGIQQHHLRVLGEFPVRKADGSLLDPQGNPDTSFMVRLPADTPFLFQSIDKRGLALDIETSARTMARGEQQLCGGCHVHTRAGLDPFQSLAKRDISSFGDFTGKSAPLFASVDAQGKPQVRFASDVYPALPGVNARHSFGVDWKNGISDVIQRRCASCHGEGKSAQQQTGLRLDGNDRTYDLLITNRYTREDGVRINSDTKPGDGLRDVLNNTPGTDRITPRYSCCTASRWVSLNSARSSMLAWALYGERMDGRDPSTGLPPASSGVPVDDWGREFPEVWPKVGEHAAYVSDMTEDEKRLITRWLDLGAPKANVHDDLARPVLTLTPIKSGNQVNTVLVGMWDDSALDYSRFVVRDNGTVIMTGAQLSGSPNTVTVALPTPITEANADQHNFEFEIWDRPDRSLSELSPGKAAANRTRLSVTGRDLLRMVNTSANHAPRSTSAAISAVTGVATSAVPMVDDPDVGDSHLISFVSQPANGKTWVENNKLMYQSTAGYIGADSFTYQVADLGGLSVKGTATVSVAAAAAPATPVQGGRPVPGRAAPPRSAVSTGDGGSGSSGGGGALPELAVLLMLSMARRRWPRRRE